MLSISLAKFKIDKHFKTALLVSLFVGTILNLINNLDVVLTHQFTVKTISKITLTYITPFCVSLYSSKKAMKQSS